MVSYTVFLNDMYLGMVNADIDANENRVVDVLVSREGYPHGITVHKINNVHYKLS